MAPTTVVSAETLRLRPLGKAEEEGHQPVPLTKEGQLLLGRGRGCDLCLADPTISRRHVSIVHREGRWYVIDLGGRLGTNLNGIRLGPEQPTMVAPGDYMRVGPYSFRFDLGSPDGSTITSTMRSVSPGTIVERVPQRDLGAMAQRRLDLLIEGAAAIHRATAEAGLARALVELLLEGTGYPRAAILRALGGTDRVEVIASGDHSGVGGDGDGDFVFSQSLLREASAGGVARISQQAAARGQSIERLGITAALCAAVMVDDNVVGYLYLDSRGAEAPGDADAAGFCQAVSKLAGLALANLMRAELEKRQLRLEEDLRGARQAQAFLGPRADGEVGALRFAGKTEPGRVVAGDLFDIFAVDERLVAVCFGDVTGQGMPAAIQMTAVASYLRAALARYREPAAATAAVNRYLTERTPEHVFASLWVGVLDAEVGTLRYVDAGHGHWCLRRQGAAPEPAGRPGGMLIGIDPDYPYEAVALELRPSDRLILISDGVIERTSPDGEQFGMARALQAMSAATSPAEDVEMLFCASADFAETGTIADDTSVASIELLAAGARPSSRPS